MAATCRGMGSGLDPNGGRRRAAGRQELINGACRSTATKWLLTTRLCEFESRRAVQEPLPERRGSGLQTRLHQFESGRALQRSNGREANCAVLLTPRVHARLGSNPSCSANQHLVAPSTGYLLRYLTLGKPEWYILRSEEFTGRLDQLKSAPCLDCGITYPPYVMQFDHRPGVKKVANVPSMRCYNWNKVIEEIAKCDLVCANCHAERTHLRRSVAQPG